MLKRSPQTNGSTLAAQVDLERATKKYGNVEVIHGLDLSIKPGEFVVFVGPSGCGKSTLLRMIAGLEEISDGTLRIDGEVMNRVPPARRGIAMVFQSYALYPHMTVYQNLAFGLETAGHSKPFIRERVTRAARILQIEPLLDRKPKALSGGQRQRVAIGRAIVREPRLFLFDEPLSNLDAELRVQMRVEISKLHKSLGTTMIYVTHDQVEAMTMADKIVVLQSGRIEQIGAPLELYNRPQNLFVASFIGSPKMNLIPAVGESAEDGSIRLRSGFGDIILPSAGWNVLERGDSLTFGIRPEHIRIGSPTGTPPVTDALLASVNVQLVEQLGGETLLYTSTADGQSLIINLAGQHFIEVGSTIQATFDPQRCHLFDSSGRSMRRDTSKAAT